MDEKRRIHGKVEIDDRGEPVCRKISGIGDDKVCPSKHVADLYHIRTQTDRRGRDQITDRGDSLLVQRFRIARRHGTQRKINL